MQSLLMVEMPRRGVNPKLSSYVALLSAFVSKDRHNEAVEMFHKIWQTQVEVQENDHEVTAAAAGKQDSRSAGRKDSYSRFASDRMRSRLSKLKGYSISNPKSNPALTL